MSTKPKTKTSSIESSIWGKIPLVGYALILVAVSFLLYSNTLNHGFTMDDPLVITGNSFVNGNTFSISKIWSSSYLEGFNGEADAAYRPISVTQFALEYNWFNGNSQGMHAMHILYFCLSILLCFFFSYQLFRKNKLLAFLTTLLFLCHPVHTEVVNNLKSRDEIMLLIGIFGMGYFYIRSLERSQIKNLSLAIAFYLVALFSKESAVSYFVLIPFIHFWITEGEWKKGIKNTVVFTIAAIFYLAVRTSIVGMYDVELDYMNNALVSQGGIFGRFPDAIKMMGKYLLILVFPYPLSADYSFNSIPMTGWKSVFPYISLIVIGGFAYLIYKSLKNKTIWHVFIIWFFATIIVSANIFVLIGSTFAERFLFVPSFAFAGGIVYLIMQYFKKVRKIGVIIIMVLSLIYASLTYQRNKVWKSDLTLFSNDIKHQQNNARMQTFYGKFTYDAAKESIDDKKTENLYKASKKALEKAAEIAPDYKIAHHYRGFVAKAQQDYLQAEESFQKVVKLDPDFNVARLQLAIALTQNKKFDKAIKEYLYLIDNGMKDITTLSNLGYAYFMNENYLKAEENYLKAYSIDSENVNLLSNMVKLYRDGMNNIPKAMNYNEQLKKVK